MKNVICLLLALVLCVSFACTAFASETGDDFVESPGATEPGGCEHEETILVGKKDATCTMDGYTGDLVCAHCDKVIEPGKPIPKHGHNFVNGVCAICGADQSNHQTGDTSGIFLWLIIMVAAVMSLVGVTVVYRKKFANR